MDRTLLHDSKQVSQRTIDALISCRDKGPEIIIATARLPRSIKRMLPDELLQFGYIIYYNGALTINESTKDLFHIPINNDQIISIYNYLSKLNPESYFTFEVEEPTNNFKCLVHLKASWFLLFCQPQVF